MIQANLSMMLLKNMGLARSSSLHPMKPLGASPKALRSIADLDDSLHLYPDGNCTELKNAIARHEKVAAESVILGNGSNEVLELIARAWLNPSRNAITSRHALQFIR